MDDQPIIIIKKKNGHSDHHGGAWKVAYADFVTAMMAFFLVMWILGLNQNVRQSIAAYFQDPSGMRKIFGGGVSPVSMGRDSANSKATILPSLPSLLSDSGQSARFKIAKETLEKKIARLPEFKAFRSHVEIAVTKEGLRIELMEGSEAMFFQTGSAQLKPQTVDLLRLVGRELGKLPNDVIIEGHTDARPYAGGNAGYSNWELSSDRANSARRALLPNLRPNQISEVRGYADRRLRDPAHPLRYSNRRISILVEYARSADGRPSQTSESDTQAGSVAPDFRPISEAERARAVRSTVAEKPRP
jgi:chemotaxis protein MotB